MNNNKNERRNILNRRIHPLIEMNSQLRESARIVKDRHKNIHTFYMLNSIHAHFNARACICTIFITYKSNNNNKKT